MVAARKSTFSNTRATCSVLTSCSGPFSSQTWATVSGPASRTAGLLPHPSSMPGKDLDSPTVFNICLTVPAHCPRGGTHYKNGMPLSFLKEGFKHGPHPGGNLWEISRTVLMKISKSLPGQAGFNKSNHWPGTREIPGKAENATSVTTALKNPQISPKDTISP